jgi:hypothetical protein
VVEEAIGKDYPLPSALQALVTKEKKATPLGKQYENLKALLLENQ